MASTLKVDNIIATDGTTAPITLSGDTATLGSAVTFPAGHIVRTDYAYDAAANWIETTSTSYQASGIIVNAGTANTGENIIVTCNIRNSSAFQANLIATYYHKIGTSGTYADILANGSGDGERFFLKYYSNYPFQPLTLTIVHRSPSTSDDNFYQIYFKSGTSGSKARLAWYGSGIEFFAQRVTFNSSTELGL